MFLYKEYYLSAILYNLPILGTQKCYIILQ